MAFPSYGSTDVIEQEQSFAFNCTASGSIKKGQFVYPSGGSFGDVMVIDGYGWATGGPAAGYTPMGVAAYDVDHGDPVGVYGPGNIVHCAATGAIKIGQPVVAVSDGWISGSIAFISGASNGVAMESISAGDTGRVLLK